MNQKLRVLIVEDELAEADHLKAILSGFGHQVVGVCSTLEQALQSFDQHDPDICIVDVYLEGSPDGIIFAEELNTRRGVRKPFVFLTSSGDTTTFRLASRTSPHSYLLKPFNPLELKYALELAMEKFISETNARLQPGAASGSSTVFVKRGHTLVKVMPDDIKYIEVEGKYCKLVCREEKFLVQQPLKELSMQLPPSQFFRVHRNYVVNIKEVARIDTRNDECFFRDGSSLIFSRRYLDRFLEVFRVLK
jgi:DNA-binding LytR/AlgR family response regulator